MCDQIWRNFAALATNWDIFGHICKVHFVFGKVVSPIWDNLYDFGQIFIVVNGQILKNQFGHLVTLSGQDSITSKTLFTLYNTFFSLFNRFSGPIFGVSKKSIWCIFKTNFWAFSCRQKAAEKPKNLADNLKKYFILLKTAENCEAEVWCSTKAIST